MTKASFLSCCYLRVAWLPAIARPRVLVAAAVVAGAVVVAAVAAVAAAVAAVVLVDRPW